jgi:hypothetical protein
MKNACKPSTKFIFCFDQHAESTQSISVYDSCWSNELTSQEFPMVETGSNSNATHQPLRQRTFWEIYNVIYMLWKNESVTKHIRNESPQFPLWFCTKRTASHKKQKFKIWAGADRYTRNAMYIGQHIGVNVVLPPSTRYPREGSLPTHLNPSVLYVQSILISMI